MRKKIAIPSLALTLFAIVSALLLIANPLPDDSAARLYESYIDKYISACNLKERLLKDSRFQHIRKNATLAMKKATFFKVNKERLVAEMIQAKIAKKYHHIDAYLNQQFLESLLKDSRMAHRRATRHR